MRLIIELPLVNENCKHQAWFAVKNEAPATNCVTCLVESEDIVQICD
ncbi:hypothetical protein UUU_11160 [Klebsiella pneumoniae subsp. pneumoniae DSM 30104 = JCM 1662 = NBRC 14940]|jgi:hypothetical protein|nr:hypothetical protein UUU_11160 [Klebsiella pneumoniae subsp. pneumoniae DSM 30104 = JCM 1662 = NBRC 14940]